MGSLLLSVLQSIISTISRCLLSGKAAMQSKSKVDYSRLSLVEVTSSDEEYELYSVNKVEGELEEREDSGAFSGPCLRGTCLVFCSLTTLLVLVGVTVFTDMKAGAIPGPPDNVTNVTNSLDGVQQETVILNKSIKITTNE